MNATTQATTVAEAAAMARALELSLRGPATGRNPRVGAVLLDSDGATVSEGWHEGSGTPHAEIVALNEANRLGVSTAGLTAVVTLEPCSHTGKTGPCVEALISAGVSRVVFGSRDPGSTSGGGESLLRDAGVDVVGGLMADAALALIERWHQAVSLGRPWVTIKWAMSWDGRAAAADGTSQWITGAKARERVHLDRSGHDAIVVGTTTALVDDPTLTARLPSGGLYDHQPKAIVVGARSVPEAAKVRSHPGGFLHWSNHDLTALLAECFSEDLRSVYVEGGPMLASAFIEAGLVDELHITVGPLLLGGPKLALGELGIGTMSEALALEIRELTQLDDDVVVIARPRGEKR